MQTTNSGPPKGLDQDGFSLVELLIATTVSMLILGGLVTAIFQSQVTQEAREDLNDLRQHARVVMNDMADEFRMAGFDLGTAPGRVVAASGTLLAVVADVDNGDAAPPCNLAMETAVGGGAERLEYRQVGTQLLKKVDCWDGGAWANEFTNAVVATDLETARNIFRYFDEFGNQIVPGGAPLNATERDQIRVIQIDLSFIDGDVQALGDPNIDFQLTTSVRLRNATP